MSQHAINVGVLARCADLEDALRARDECLHRLSRSALSAKAALRAAHDGVHDAQEAAAVASLACARAHALFSGAAAGAGDPAVERGALSELAAECAHESDNAARRAHELVARLRECLEVLLSPALADPAGDALRASKQRPDGHDPAGARAPTIPAEATHAASRPHSAAAAARYIAGRVGVH